MRRPWPIRGYCAMDKIYISNDSRTVVASTLLLKMKAMVSFVTIEIFVLQGVTIVKNIV